MEPTSFAMSHSGLGGQRGNDRRASAGTRLDHEPSAGDSESFPHARETDAASVERRIEADAGIAHDQADFARSIPDVHECMLRLTVARHVVKGFLRDAKETQCEIA